MPVLEKGYIQVYAGEGKGKTTAALGVALRMAGCGGRTLVVQFMKGYPYSETKALSLLPGLTLVQTGRADYVYKDSIEPVDYVEAKRGLAVATEGVASGEYDLVILDELNVALSFGLVDLLPVLDLIERRAPRTELIFTGRNPPTELVDRADLVTEMVEIRHPFQKGLLARKGIDC